MPSERWSQLKHRLLDRGWTWRDEALHAPHETLWVTPTADEPNLENLRGRMSLAAEKAAEYAAYSTGHAALYDDLISLVEVLDELLVGAARYRFDDPAPYELLN
jgi:hypothetical protein